MRIGREKMMTTAITAWGYNVTYVELISVIASLIAVFLGALGSRSEEHTSELQSH